jgi:hypothetical protein
MTIAQVLQDLGRRPWWHVRAHWNWKTAILSVTVRGSVFFLTNLAFGFSTATRAWLLDTAFRIPLVGVSGAIDQAFTEAEPVWAATAVVMVAVPLLSRAIEFLIHRLAGTPELLVGVQLCLPETSSRRIWGTAAMVTALLKDRVRFSWTERCWCFLEIATDPRSSLSQPSALRQVSYVRRPNLTVCVLSVSSSDSG